MNFGGVPERRHSLENSRIVIVPVPYHGTSTWIKGDDHGPEAFMETSANKELSDIDTISEVYKQGLYTDVPILEKSFQNERIKAVEKRIQELLAWGNLWLPWAGGILKVLARFLLTAQINLSAFKLQALREININKG